MINAMSADIYAEVKIRPTLIFMNNDSNMIFLSADIYDEVKIRLTLIFIGPRYTWGPIYGSECLKLSLRALCRLN